METKQVKFRVWPNDAPYGGILVDNKFVICGCCGGVFGLDEIEILVKYENWVSISDEITGEE